jgi:hypothetical protein
MHRLHGMHAGAGRAGEHGVGRSAPDRDQRLAHRQMSTCLPQCQRVARPAQIVVDGDVAGGHVRQILEQPERRDPRHAIRRPAIEGEPARGIAALRHARGKIFGHGEHVIGAEHAADPLGRVMDRHAGSVVQGPLGGRDRHLALPTHHLEPLADRLLPLPFQRPEIVDVAGEGPGLRGVMQRETGRGEEADVAHPAASLDEARPELVQRQAERRDDAHPGDHDPSFSGAAHECFPRRFLCDRSASRNAPARPRHAPQSPARPAAARRPSVSRAVRARAMRYDRRTRNCCSSRRPPGPAAPRWGCSRDRSRDRACRD